ncbi:MAG: tRNA pseudouridine(55) synthase TruB [Thermodesulfovibrionales bacterium]|nr:tRNA pseudouridine(55) synthase TruB [Thermodesulfovibrionales bacterium]
MNCIINLDKPENISSQHAVTKVKKLLAVKKAGHAGTLDPIATGVLLVCLNKATKIARFLSDLDKEYIFRMKLGERTDTYDSTGTVLARKDYHFIQESDVRHALENFTGRVKQVPPLFSAIKVGGQRLYNLARKGITDVQIPERTVSIHELELIGFDPPFIDLRVACSKGTYVRSLCDDLGAVLGAGAHMTSLQRTAIGKFRIEEAVMFSGLEQGSNLCYPMDFALSHLPGIILSDQEFMRVGKGLPIKAHQDFSVSQYIRLKSPENVFFGIGKIEQDEIRIERLLN